MRAKKISGIKKKYQEADGILIFEDEAAFRQDPTIFLSWFRCGSRSYIPAYEQRNTLHVYGAICIHDVRLSYRFTDTCNGSTHREFLKILFTPHNSLISYNHTR